MKKKYLLIGNNIISDYFKNHEDFDVVSYEWIYDTDYSYEIIGSYDVIIYCEENKEGTISELISVNQFAPNNILHFLHHVENKKVQFVYISTADLYNGNYEWEKTKENLNDLNTSSPYLLTKRLAELCIVENGGLVLRIKNPFSEHYHPDNWLVKALKSDVPKNWMDCHTYLPDLEKALFALLEKNERGIYNIVQTETGSDLYYLQLLNLSKYRDFDIDKDGDVDDDKIGADVNSCKIANYISLQPMNFAVIYSYEKLKDKLDNLL
jgi:nucleoside-diphosphate-sugar epimerase